MSALIISAGFGRAYAAVALKTSLLLAEVMMLREMENRAVKAATAPIRPGMLCIAYNTDMPATGRSEDTRVERTLRGRNRPPRPRLTSSIGPT